MSCTPAWGELPTPERIDDILTRNKPVLPVLERQTRSTSVFPRMRSLQRKVKGIEERNDKMPHSQQDLSNLQKDLQKRVADIQFRIPIVLLSADVLFGDVRVAPFTEPPGSLGGLPDSGIDNLASNTSSFYCNLERPKSLSEVEDACVDEKDVKEACLALCNGAFKKRIGRLKTTKPFGSVRLLTTMIEKITLFSLIWFMMLILCARLSIKLS